ncbi:hypothetical protein DNTS_026412 [Danionella cerebrum]|uniref:Ig-like domain-containing protein n=1 Tax=Danionella cerebrum TaxID=2873325 RepID=A0A553Q8I7_9TELE|nr:hypothetical protein DNTS_026412 [Danionella translucida]
MEKVMEDVQFQQNTPQEKERQEKKSKQKVKDPQKRNLRNLEHIKGEKAQTPERSRRKQPENKHKKPGQSSGQTTPKETEVADEHWFSVSHTSQGVCSQLQPQNAVVLRGSKARFNCSSLQPQSIMTWTLNGRLVLTILESSGAILNSTERYSATNFSTSEVYKWEFLISNVQRSDAGDVNCQVLGGGAQAASLMVQERGSVEITDGNQTKTEGAETVFGCMATSWYPEPNMSWSVNGEMQGCNRSSVAWGSVFNSSCLLTFAALTNSSVQCLVSVPALGTPDRTTVFLTVVKPNKRDQMVLIATTVAFSAVALLFLIIYGIVFFCTRRKKKSSYQEEVRRAQVSSPKRTVTEDRGRENREHFTDGPVGLSNDGVWYTQNSQKLQGLDGYFEDNHRKHRHLTIV